MEHSACTQSMRARLKTFLLGTCLLFACARANPQDASSLVHDGDIAASQDRHLDAIKSYEAAIAADPSMRERLLAKLGRQHLWAEHNSKAAQLLGQYVATHPSECDVRRDWALALSWANRLKA